MAQEIDIDWPEFMTTEAAVVRIETWIVGNELTSRLKTIAAAYPGSVHWHLVKPKVSGTLELTIAPTKRRVWFALRSNRYASWMDALPESLAESFKSSVPDAL